jgi:hypothetical protein
MSDSFTTVEHKGWLSRLGGSIVAAGFGLLLFVAMFPLLWWNEGRAVKTHLDLEEGRHNVVETPLDTIDTSLEGKLVHLSGTAKTDEVLKDDFGAEANALQLRRVVEMLQWKEKKESKRRKKIGGGEETITEYSYSREWSDSPISSSSFKRTGHENPGAFPFHGQQRTATNVSLGAHRLNAAQVAEIENFQRLPLDAISKTIKVPDGFRTDKDQFYRGANSDSPAIGDMRFYYEIVPATMISLVFKQVGAGFEPYTLSSGRLQELLVVGEQSAEEMYLHAESVNEMITWAVRAAGLFGMWFGLFLASSPLSVLLDILPIAGTIVSWGTGAMALVIAMLCSSITIAVSWFAYRPLYAVLVVVAAVALVFVLKLLFGKSKQPAPSELFSPPPPPPPPMPV